MWVAGIFAGATSSPSLSWRQRSDRYAIRAGRNLPDKEFRYLRTVIVTAAIHQGFGSQLHLAANRSPSPSDIGQASAPIRRLSTSQRPVFLVNSRQSLDCAPHIAVGPPSPEVTGATCRVPSREFSRSPELTKLTYLCRFAVRVCIYSTTAFLGARSDLKRNNSRSPTNRSSNGSRRVPADSTYIQSHGISTVCPSPTPFGLGLGPD